MTANWAIDKRVAVSGKLAATRVTDATPVLTSAIDIAALGDGVRPMFILTAFETNVANTGGVWAVTESATAAGSYTAATVSTALVATPAVAGNDVQVTTLSPNAAKPFVKVSYTGADANAEVDITVTLVAIPRGI